MCFCWYSENDKAEQQKNFEAEQNQLLKVLMFEEPFAINEAEMDQSPADQEGGGVGDRRSSQVRGGHDLFC